MPQYVYIYIYIYNYIYNYIVKLQVINQCLYHINTEQEARDHPRPDFGSGLDKTP